MSGGINHSHHRQSIPHGHRLFPTAYHSMPRESKGSPRRLRLATLSFVLSPDHVFLSSPGGHRDQGVATFGPVDLREVFFSDDLSAILFFPLGNRPVCQLSTVTPAFVVDCTDQFQTGFPNEQLCIPSRFLPVFRLGTRAVSLTGMVLIPPLFMYQPSLS